MTGTRTGGGQLALQGLEDADREAAAALAGRLYEGPPDPDALLSHVGLAAFRPGQREAVAAALEGRDALVVMPTGGGKSLCYQLPGLATSDLTIVVSPLIALMADQWRRLSAAGHPAVMIASGLGADPNAAAVRSIRDGSARVVYCSPERFGSSAFLAALESRRVDLMAIDEAHCLSEWGHDFRPDYLRLPKAIARLGRPAVMACTATATEEVAREVISRLGLTDPLEVRSGFDRPNISFDTVRLEGKGSKARKAAVLAAGLADPANRPAIVYCGTRRDTEDVAEMLAGEGRAVARYHAGLPSEERARAQRRFMSGEAEVVVATNAFGMGIDKADVRSVWHWAIPTSVEAYYQEAGRAGRDGLPARAVLLAMRSDLGRLIRFNQRRAIDPAGVEAYVEAMRNVAEEGRLIIDAPDSDEDRIRLAVAERVGACTIEPAGGRRLVVELGGSLDRRAVAAACAVAKDRGWRAYRAVEEFSFSADCRRRMLLDHFGDPAPGAPSGRCCDACDPADWLPDQATLPALGRRRGVRAAPPGAEVRLSGADAELFEELRAWRAKAAAGKPAYTVAHDRTLRDIAVARPGDSAALREISGVGPAFVSRHADEVLALVGR